VELAQVIRTVLAFPIVQVLRVVKSYVMNQMFHANLRSTVGREEHIAIVILSKIVVGDINLEARLEVLLASVLVLEEKGEASVLEVDVKGLICELHLAPMLGGVVQKLVALVPKLGRDHVVPHRVVELQLVLVRHSILQDLDVQSIELPVKSLVELKSTLHWVVSQDVQPKLSGGEGGVFFVMNR